MIGEIHSNSLLVYIYGSSVCSMKAALAQPVGVNLDRARMRAPYT